MNIFVPNVFNKRNLPEIHDKNFISCFNQAKESVSAKKNVVKLLNKTVSNKEKREVSSKKINKQNKIKAPQ